MTHGQRSNWIAAALLFCLVASIHYDIIFLGRSLVHSNYFNPLDPRALPDNYGADLIPHEEWTRRNLWPYANIRDPAATWWQWEPSTVFLLTAIETREWPFWDPYVAAGTPAMANLVPAFFFPPYVIVVALGASVTLRNAYFLALLWGAGFFTYLFLRRHAVSPIASLAGGGLVVMSGGLNQNLGSFMGQTACCLPGAAYATRAFLDRPIASRMAALAAVYGSVALASFPPLLVAMFGILTLYVIVVTAVEGPHLADSLRIGARWCGAVLLSIGLVAFYYGPAMALRHDAPQVAAMYQGAGLETMPATHILQLFSPTVLGGVPIYLNGPFAVQWSPHIPYVGAVAVLCALLARPTARRRSRALWISSGAAAVLILLKLFGVPPVQWIGHVAPFDQIHMAYYFGVPLGFLVAVLAALGIDALLLNRASLAAALGAVAAVGGSVEGLWRLSSRAGVFETAVASHVVRDWKLLAVVAGAAAIGTVLGSAGRTQTRRTAAVVSLLALAVIEGVYNNSYPSPRRWDIFEHPVPLVRMLQREADSDRVFSFAGLNANLNEGFGIFGLDSLMAFNPPRIFELYRRHAGGSPEVFMRSATQIPPEPVLDRANVSFVAVNRSLVDAVRAVEARNYVSRFDDGFVKVYERPRAPRFFYSSEYRLVSKTAALDLIATAGRREIVIESPPGFASAPNQETDPAVGLESYRRNSFALTVDAPRPGFVYASESYFEGWSARVNGQETPIFPANYAFRAVPVPAGPARVEFRYWPPGLTGGLAASSTSLAVLLALVLIDARRRTGTIGERFSATRPAAGSRAGPSASGSPRVSGTSRDSSRTR